jgi:hypothetical protein
LVPNGALPLAQQLDAQREQAMELVQKARQLTASVRDDQVLVGGHHGGAVHGDAEARGQDGEAVTEEVVELGIRT